MTSAIKTFLETFDALSDAERREAAVEILRRMMPADGELPEGALVETADALFRILDAEEGAHASP